MKKKPVVDDDDPLDREFDFTNARPNPYFVAYHGPKVIRVLEADVADAFPDDEAVNAALRSVMDARKKKISAHRTSAPRTKTKKAGQ